MLGNEILQQKALQAAVSPGSCEMHIFPPVQQKNGRAQFEPCQKYQCGDRAKMAHGSDSRVTCDVQFQPLYIFRPLRGQTATPEDPCMCCNYPGTNIYRLPVGEGLQTRTRRAAIAVMDVGHGREEEQRCVGSLSSN